MKARMKKRTAIKIITVLALSFFLIQSVKAEKMDILEEGCTPGFWKENPGCWWCVFPDDLVKDTFPVTMQLPPEIGVLGDDTLMDALNYRGGNGLAGAGHNMLRQAVAALLNACDPDIAYPLSADEEKELVRISVESLDTAEMLDLTDVFDMLNNLGCPIDTHCRSYLYRGLEMCSIPVKMSVGYYIQSENYDTDKIVPDWDDCCDARQTQNGKYVECEKCRKQQITLHQCDCGDIGKDTGDWPCYSDCVEIEIRANFDVKLGLHLDKNHAGEDIIGEWNVYADCGDIVPGDGEWHTIKVYVKAWKTQIYKAAPGDEVDVGTLRVTVKPNV